MTRYFLKKDVTIKRAMETGQLLVLEKGHEYIEVEGSYGFLKFQRKDNPEQYLWVDAIELDKYFRLRAG